MSRIRKIAPLAVLVVFALITLLPIQARADRDRGHDRDRPRPAWGRGDIRHFHRYDDRVWRGGRWYHGNYGGRIGWWWIVAGTWYFYTAPVYPYPNPYVPPVVVNTYPSTPPAPGPAPTEYWYYCKSSKTYYPYVPTCPEGWEKVPATPPQN